MKKTTGFMLCMHLALATTTASAREANERRGSAGSGTAYNLTSYPGLTGRVVKIEGYLIYGDAAFGATHQDDIRNVLTPGLLSDDGTPKLLVVVHHLKDRRTGREVVPFPVGAIVHVTGRLRSRSRINLIEVGTTVPLVTESTGRGAGTAPTRTDAWALPMGRSGSADVKTGTMGGGSLSPARKMA